MAEGNRKHDEVQRLLRFIESFDLIDWEGEPDAVASAMDKLRVTLAVCTVELREALEWAGRREH